MAKIPFSQYHKEDLKGLAERLKTDYYDQIAEACRDIDQSAGIVKKTADRSGEQMLYVSLCSKLTEELREGIHIYQVEIVPYILDLCEKRENKHDCSLCNGGCKSGHSIKLATIKATHQKIKEIIYRINQLDQSEGLHSCKDEDNCTALRNKVLLLDSTITELFYLEEAILIPKIQEAQSNINVS
jgi:hypothetical protein